jgi:hypothetical protein
MSPAAVSVGERVVAYFDHIGGIEGIVARTFEGGFAIKIAATRHKREKLAAQLTWLANRSELGADGRRHERVAPKNGEHTLQLEEGIALTCRVLDVSISGASVATPARPQIGTELVLGKLRARVVRHHPQGFGVEFLDIQNPTALRRHFG